MRLRLLGLRSSLISQATSRLILTFCAATLVVAALSYWFYHTTREEIAEQRSREAVAHFSQRIHQLEYDWENYTMRLRYQIEFSKILLQRDDRWQHLTSYMVTLTRLPSFGGMLIADRSGRVLFSYGTMSEALPPHSVSVPKTEWFFDPAGKRLYQVYHQPIWLGPDGAGQLILFKVLDNATLFNNSYPETALFLEWQGKIIASSIGDSGQKTPLADEYATSTRDGKIYRQVALKWSTKTRETPQLIIQQRTLQPIKILDLFLMVGAMLLTLALFAWLVMGRWLARTTQRTKQLAIVTDAFADQQRLTRDIQNTLRATKSDFSDEIDHLCNAMSTLMKTVEVRDVEQQLYQSELKRRMDELVRINTELDEFTHFVSHDLREPLRKLVSFSDLLRGDLADNMPAQAEEDLHYIEDSAARMRALVDALLALSHAGKTPLVPQHVDMDEVVTRALDNLGLSIEESGAVISRTQLPPVTGDPLLLTQLYQNLIGNALKYVPAGTSPQVSITYDPQSGAYGVKDNGIGINTVFFKQIFKPFKRLHSREEYEGSGIGLSICRKIMDRHQGKIWVESVHGQGAHFKFTLGTHLQTDATVTRLQH